MQPRSLLFGALVGAIMAGPSHAAGTFTMTTPGLSRDDPLSKLGANGLSELMWDAPGPGIPTVQVGMFTPDNAYGLTKDSCPTCLFSVGDVLDYMNSSSDQYSPGTYGWSASLTANGLEFGAPEGWSASPNRVTDYSNGAPVANTSLGVDTSCYNGPCSTTQTASNGSYNTGTSSSPSPAPAPSGGGGGTPTPGGNNTGGSCASPPTSLADVTCRVSFITTTQAILAVGGLAVALLLTIVGVARIQKTVKTAGGPEGAPAGAKGASGKGGGRRRRRR